MRNLIDAHIGERVQSRHHNQSDHHRRDHVPEPPTIGCYPFPQMKEHLRPKEHQQRRYRNEVARELDLKRPRNQQVRNDPRQEQHRSPRLPRPHPQCSNQRREGNHRCGGYEDDAGRDEKQPHRDEPSDHEVDYSVVEPHSPQTRVQQARPRDDSERPAQSERRQLPHVIKVCRRVDVLPRVRVVTNPPHHFRLLGNVRDESRRIDDGVRLNDDERRQRRASCGK